MRSHITSYHLKLSRTGTPAGTESPAETRHGLHGSVRSQPLVGSSRLSVRRCAKLKEFGCVSHRAVLPEDEDEVSQGRGVFQSTPDCAERMTGSRRSSRPICPARSRPEYVCLGSAVLCIPFPWRNSCACTSKRRELGPWSGCEWSARVWSGPIAMERVCFLWGTDISFSFPYPVVFYFALSQVSRDWSFKSINLKVRQVSDT